MFPRVYQTLRTSSVVLSLVSTRISRHGEIAQTETRPYITWQIVSGLPHDNLSDIPGSDFTTVQIDCYAVDQTTVESLATGVRSALDLAMVVNRLVLTNRDPDTRLYRVGFEADFIERRPTADVPVVQD